MFLLPYDTITLSQIVNKNSSTTLVIASPSKPITVLTLRSSHGSQDFIDQFCCGNFCLVYSNLSSIATDMRFVNITCIADLSYRNGGTTDKDDILVNYLPYQRTLTSDWNGMPISSSSQGTQLNVSTTNGQFDGTILTNYFLLICMVGLTFGFIFKNFFRQKK